MAPARNSTANRNNDDLDDLFNFLDADNNDASQSEQRAPAQEVNAAPNRRRLDGDDPLGLGLGIDEEIKVRKPRAPIAKLDEDRLLSEKGIPTLRRITKERLRFKGKGHEVCNIQSSIHFSVPSANGLVVPRHFAAAEHIPTMAGLVVPESKLRRWCSDD